MNKYQFRDNQQNTYFQKLPFFKKEPNLRKLLGYSNSYLTPAPEPNNLKFSSTNTRTISHGSFGINIHTKLYRISEYLNKTNREINLFKTTNFFPRTKSMNEISYINKKDDLDKFKADTGQTYQNFFKKKKLEFRINNIIKLDLNKKNIDNNYFIKSESENNFDNDLDQLNDNNTTNEYIIKKINNYNLNLLKKSRYFSHTKYIINPKNKLNENKRQGSRSCSTKNISLENTGTTTSGKKTINDIRVEQLLNKHKNIEKNDKNINIEDNSGKVSEKGMEYEKNYKNKIDPLFYDFIPIILQHLKQKEAFEESYKDSEILYNKINSIYNNNKNLKNKSRFTTLKTKNGEFLFENPIIRYLFLEKTLYNLRHSVEFIDIKNQEELEQKVFKVIGDEYQKMKEKKFSYDIHDFITYGYEFDPKLLIKLKQDDHKFELKKFLNDQKMTMNKSIQKNSSTKLSVISNRGGLFTINKSDFKNIDKTLKSREEKSKSSSDGILTAIFKQQYFHNKIRKFEGLKFREKEREKYRQIDSNRDQNISNLILKDMEINNFMEEKINNYNDNNDKENDNDNENENILIGTGTTFQKNNEINKNIESDKDQEKSKNNDTNEKNVFPRSIFQNDTLRLIKPIDSGSLTTLTKQFLNDEKRHSNKKLIQKPKSRKKSVIENDNSDLNKIPSTQKSSIPKESNKVRLSKPSNSLKNLNIRKVKKKKKTNTIRKKSPPPSNIEPTEFDLIQSTVPLKPIEEEEKKETPKIEIKDQKDYEKYKEEAIKKNEMDKETKNNLINEIKKEDLKRSTMRKNADKINELQYSLNYRKQKTTNYDTFKKFEKIKKNDFVRKGSDDLINELKKMKEKGIEENKIEIEEEDDDEDEDEDESVSESLTSSDFNGLDNLDIMKDIENKGEVMKKKWMENSPRFKNRILELCNRRRNAISAESYKMLDNLTKNERIMSLNDRMKNVYAILKKKRKERKKNKRKKKRYFNFIGVDLTKVDEIEKQKKVYLYRLKEDIKYKISEGKYHLIEMENFKHFENAMNKFRLKDAFDPNKVKLYINLVKKYLHFYKVQLDNKEREKNDEDRINRFLRNLRQEVYETLPTVKLIQGRNCHARDYFQELQLLSEIHGFLM